MPIVEFTHNLVELVHLNIYSLAMTSGRCAFLVKQSLELSLNIRDLVLKILVVEHVSMGAKGSLHV